MDLREQIRDVAEFQRSNRRPVELVEVEAKTARRGLAKPRRRVSGPLAAVMAMALVLLVGGGLALLFSATRENPPADSLTPTTHIVPTTTPAEGSSVTEIVTTSDGPLNVRVEWRKLNETVSRSGLEIALPLFPGYDVSIPGMLWRVDGEWVFPLSPNGPGEPNHYAFSRDGYSWDVRPILSGSPVTAEDFYVRPDIRDGLPLLHQYSRSWNMWMNLPDDAGSPPESVHHAYHDGNQWHEVSFDAGFLAEAAGDESVTLTSMLACSASDTIVFYELREEGLEDVVVSPVIVDGFLHINGDQATQLTEPPVARRPDGSLDPRSLVCWEDGTYNVSGDTVYQLKDGGWQPVAPLPTDEIEPSRGWSPESGYYMNRSGSSLWVTQDFESWKTYQLPDAVLRNLLDSPTRTIIRRDGLWMVGSTLLGTPPEGLWISEDLKTWELIPIPRLTNSGDTMISLPIDGLLIATPGQMTRNVWVGRFTR